MAFQACHRFARVSPRKVRPLADLIRGKFADEALAILHFSPKHSSTTAEQVLRSAISNLQSKDEGGRVDTATMYVKEVFVNGGPMTKRISAAPMGRAFRIRKRSHHLTIVVATKEQKVKVAAKPVAAKAAEAPAPKPKKKTTKSAKQEPKKATKES